MTYFYIIAKNISMGKFSSGHRSGFEEDDEQSLLDRASRDRAKINSPENIPRRESSSIQTVDSGKRYTILQDGTSHQHCLPSCLGANQTQRRRKNSYGSGETVLHSHDPDMSLPFDTVWSASSTWFGKFMTKGLGNNQEQVLSTKYEYQADIFKDLVSGIKICLVREKSTPGKQPGKFFAVKIFTYPQQNSVRRYLRRDTTEFCIAHTLQHPNIVRAIELLPNDQNDFCLVMEFCDAGSLLDLLLKVSKLEPGEADCFLKQLLQGVQYMHSMGVSHRNLKPENILLTRRGQLKITDFSCAECFQMPWAHEQQAAFQNKNPRIVTTVKETQGLKGTIPFIAPEQFLRKGVFDLAAGDMWAVGIIYFTMRFGRLPWKSAEWEDSLYRDYLCDLENDRCNKYIELVTGELRRSVIYSILQPNPQARLTATQALDSDWIRGIQLCSISSEQRSEATLIS